MQEVDSLDSPGALHEDFRWLGLAPVMADVASLSGLPDSLPAPRLLDRQGWVTLVAGALLLLISFTTNSSDAHLLQLGRLPAHDSIGVGLHLPPWRRLLATLNWRLVCDIEQETERLKQENKRLAALESRVDSL